MPLLAPNPTSPTGAGDEVERIEIAGAQGQRPALQGVRGSGDFGFGRSHDFRRRLRGKAELEALQQKPMIDFGFGMTG